MCEEIQLRGGEGYDTRRRSRKHALSQRARNAKFRVHAKAVAEQRVPSGGRNFATHVHDRPWNQSMVYCMTGHLLSARDVLLITSKVLRNIMELRMCVHSDSRMVWTFLGLGRFWWETHTTSCSSCYMSPID